MPPMLVAHLAASSFVGGPETQMLGLIAALGPTDRAAVLSFSEGGRCRPLLDAARALGAEAVELSHNAPHYRASAREVASHLGRLGASVLCCHGYKPDILGLFAARVAGIPAVSISHGWTAATAKVRVNEALDRLSLHGMARVVCVSQAQARRVRRVGVRPGRIVVIPNALDARPYGETEPLTPNPLAGFFPNRPALVVGSAGRLSPEKGFGVLVEAAAIVCRDRPDVGFVHFGDGPLRPGIERQIEALGLTGRFVLGGFRKDLPSLLPHLDVFALPSFTEGLPVVILEAFASRVPVVATAVGGTPEVVSDGENGCLVPPRDPIALAARLEELLDVPDLRRAYGARGRADVLARFTFADQARCYRDLFAAIGTKAPASVAS